MNRTLVVAVAALCLNTSLAAESSVQRRPVALAMWTEADKTFRGADQKTYDDARRDHRFVLERITYPSGGLRVSAYLYRPAGTPAPLPTIIYNRGGYTTPGLEPRVIPMFHRLAQAGFVVIAPMLRQSDGSEGKDEVGGADLDDVLNLTAVFAELPFVDQTRLFMIGESRGGMMTLQAIREKFPIRAAATFGAFSDLDAVIAAKPKVYEPLMHSIFPDFDTQRAAVVERRSALKWADRLDLPLLIMHGGADSDAAPQHSLRLVSELQRLGKPVEFHLFAGARHTLAERAAERDAMIVSFFRRAMEVK